MAFNHKSFTVQLAARVFLMGLAMLVLTLLVVQPGYHGLSVLAASVFLFSVFEVWHYVQRTNKEVTRFLDAARYADYSQRFNLGDMGSGFESLGQTFNDILDQQRKLRFEQEAGLRHLRALIEHIPVPLLTVHADAAISLQNNAARRLFGATHVTRLSDLRQFGDSFHAAVAEAIPGNRELVTFSVEGVEYQLTLATTEIAITSDSQRLISLQDIQTELDETQAQAWHDLVRVLTHEIMNSITPVTSLAATASDVVADIIDKTGPDSPLAEDLVDLREAVATVARRSGSLMQFVDNYRQITRLAPPEKNEFKLQSYSLLPASWQQRSGLVTTSHWYRTLCPPNSMSMQIAICSSPFC